MPRKKTNKPRTSVNEFLQYERKIDPISGKYERKFTKSIKKARPQDVDIAIKVLAHRANQRLRELEKPTESGSRGAMNMRAYKRVEKKYVDSMPGINKTKNDRVRFSENPKKLTKLEKEKLINELRVFLTSKLSTKEGIKEKYGKMTDTYNRKYGINLTADQIGQMFDLFSEESTKKQFSSEQIVSLMKTTNIGELDEEEIKQLLRHIDPDMSELKMVRAMATYVEEAKEQKGIEFKFKKKKGNRK